MAANLLTVSVDGFKSAKSDGRGRSSASLEEFEEGNVIYGSWNRRVRHSRR